MRKKLVRPVGLKGKEKIARMKELMGESVNKDTKNYVIELTKKGPDGKVYAIVRENHQYFIKVTDKTKNIIAEDFKYMGGLQNKTEMAYPSYAKAIKHLNLKFINLSEAHNKTDKINVFENDNALGVAAHGFTQTVFEDEESMKEDVDAMNEEEEVMEGEGHEKDKIHKNLDPTATDVDPDFRKIKPGGYDPTATIKHGGKEYKPDNLTAPTSKGDERGPYKKDENIEEDEDIQVEGLRMKISRAISEDVKKKV